MVAIDSGWHLDIRTLRLFPTQHGWDKFCARDRLPQFTAALLPGLPADGSGKAAQLPGLFTAQGASPCLLSQAN